MFCPKCQYEYVAGVTTCPDCGAALVFKLPLEPAKVSEEPDESSDSVIVFESESNPDIEIAKEILDEAGIPYISGRRSNIFFGERKITIRVSGQDATGAEALLTDLAQGSRLAGDAEMEEANGDKPE